MPTHEDGSTLNSTWIAAGDGGGLERGPGEPLIDRVRLGEPAPPVGELARLVHITDAHVMDASSPARVPFLARFGPPVHSTFRPQESLTAHVLRGAIEAARRFRPQLVIEGGDLIDNAQHNELEQALALLNGGRVRPGSGPDGYHGVQLASNPDELYYRPDIDEPRHPGLLTAATAAFTSRGLGADWLPVLGDHDALVAGEIVPTALTQALATGDRALWEMPAELQLPAGLRLSSSGAPGEAPDTTLIDAFIAQALAGETVQVPPDPQRRELEFEQLIDRLLRASRAADGPRVGAAPRAERLDYVRDVGGSLRLIVLDLVRRAGGSGGLVARDQAAWLEAQIAQAGRRWLIVVTHHPLQDASGGETLLELLDTSPRVVAVLSGHTHRNRIVARETAAGGYWLITTCSLIDFPQQCRALRLLATAGGGVALQTWMLDHGGSRLGRTARELSHRDAAGRAQHLTGTRWDRNATLFRSEPGAAVRPAAATTATRSR